MIAVLLSTYNGEKFIKEQLDSIFSQNINNYIVIARDDGSSDNTYEIMLKYKNRYNNFILLPKSENVGIKKSFEKVLNYALGLDDIEYLMFCDQDDVWKSNKIEITLNKIKTLEQYYGNVPILVHTDLTVVDEKLNTISPSFWRYQHINPYKNRLNYLLVQNTVTGCTIGINKKLANCVSTFPEEAIMHDWWLALAASAFGIIGVIEDKTVFYRQHFQNDVGAEKYGLKYIIKKFFSYDDLSKNIKQAEAFFKKYEKNLNEEYYNLVKDFVNVKKYSFFKRKILFFKYKFFKHGFLRNIGVFFRI